MRKRLTTTTSHDAPHFDEGWLDLDRAAIVEVTSEEKEYPVEFALVSGEVRGWRAAASGTQTIRLIFDEPQRLTRISLVFYESAKERTQEFVLRWSPDGGRSFREIVRQQWNFSRLTQYARSRNIELNSPMSRFLNWSLCLTSVEERLAPRSRVCACLDSGVGKHGENARIEYCASLPNSLQSFRAACSREPPSTSILSNIQPEWNAEWKQPPPNFRPAIVEPQSCKQPGQQWDWPHPLPRGSPGRHSGGWLLEPFWAALSRSRCS